MRTLTFIAILNLALTCAANLSAAEKEPSVDAVLDRFVQAIGGKEAWGKIQSRRILADMETMGAQGEWTSNAKSPNLSYSRVQHPKIGLFESGFDGSTAWSKSQSRVKVKQGGELEQAKRDADFFQELHLKETFPGLTFAGTDAVAGEPSNVLESKDPQVGKQRFYFSLITGLLLRRESHFVNADGKQVTSDTLYSDYRPVDGVKYPYRQKVTVSSRGQVVNESKMVVKEIKHNERVEDSLFKMPAL